MTLVNRLYDQTMQLDDFEPKHLFFLLEQLTRRLRHDVAGIDGAMEIRAAHEPLSPSSYRVLWMIPAQGARITDLAAVASVTKQAMGQFVDVLLAGGYVTQATSDVDRRVRIVRRTAKADDLLADLDALFDRLENQWADVLGVERFAVFKGMLIELATGWEHPPRS